MPIDGKGTYRHNDQMARLHGGGKSRNEQKDEILSGVKTKGPDDDKPSDTDDQMTEVHNHGDGTFHTVHGGEEEQHESIGHMHAHLSKLHGAPGEKHFHAHDDGMESHSHSVETGGEADHREHDEPEGMKEHMAEAMGAGEEGEGERESGELRSEENTVGGLTGSRALGM